MNAKHLIAAVAALAATGSAFAQQTEWVDPAAGFVSTTTRAEVRSEFRQAHASGALDYTEFNYPIVEASGAAKTRQEVRAELVPRLRYAPNGTVNSIYFG